MNKKTIVTLIILAVLTFGGYYLFNNTKIFNDKKHYYSSFTKISGLQESGPVLVNGVKVGKVADIEIGADRNILVTYSLRPDLKIPNGTVAKVINGDVSGTKAVKLYMGKQPGFIPIEGNIPTVPDTTMMEMFNAKITPMLKGGKFLLRTVDSSLSDINYLIRYGGWGNKAQQQVRLFKRDLEGMATTSKDVFRQVDQLSATIASFNTSIPNSSRFNADVNQKLSSGLRTTKDLSDKDYDSLLRQTGASVTKLVSSLKKLSNENKMFHDKKPYVDATQQLDTANQSMSELMKDPPGIQLIGGGKKKK